MASYPSLNNQCPSCHKRFANDSNVLRHMNHPRTSCMSVFDFLESMHLPNEHPPPTDQQQNHNEPNRNETDRNETNPDTQAAGGSSAEYHEELHPNTPIVFGSGPGFIDVFNTDRHAEKRGENLYYPFSSKGEWGVASWLLCSGLSMRAIDDFLALPIVSPEQHVILPTTDKKQGPTTFAVLHNCKNPTHSHGGSSRSTKMENARNLPQRLPDRKTHRPVLP